VVPHPAIALQHYAVVPHTCTVYSSRLLWDC